MISGSERGALMSFSHFELKRNGIENLPEEGSERFRTISHMLLGRSGVITEAEATEIVAEVRRDIIVRYVVNS